MPPPPHGSRRTSEVVYDYPAYEYEEGYYAPRSGRSSRSAPSASHRDRDRERERDSNAQQYHHHHHHSRRSSQHHPYRFEEDDYYDYDDDRRNTGKSRRVSTVTVVKPQLERRGTVLPRILLLAWALFMILAWILLVAAFATPDWIEGTESTGLVNQPFLKRQVGVFRQCNTLFGGPTPEVENCFDVGLGDANVDEWEASGALFIVGIIFLSVTIVLALVASICAVGLLVPWAKGMMTLANVFFLIAFLLVPLGFNDLEDPCPTGADQGQCGLSCNSPDAEFDLFVLCSPYALASGTFLCVAGLVILFLSACFAACVRVVA